LASLRDYNAGEYHHAGLIQQFGAEVARDAILLSHREVFNRVVRCSIAELVRQIELYAASTHTLFADFAHTWEKLEPYRVIVPLGGDPLASRLFVCNVRAALAVLQGRQSRAPQDPQFALPRQ